MTLDEQTQDGPHLDMANDCGMTHSSTEVTEAADPGTLESTNIPDAAEVNTSVPMCGAGFETAFHHDFEGSLLVELRVAQNLP